MRKLAVAAAMFLSLFATPAIARDGAWYVGGEFGASIVEDMDFDSATTDNLITVEHEYGYDGGLFVGYDLGAFRIEAEVAYKKADASGFLNFTPLPGEGPVFPGGRDFAGGSTTALSFMLNGMLDFGDDDGIQGFVGAGVGMARVKMNNVRVFASSTPFLDDSDSRLAWQLFAGVRQAISDNIDVTVKYRFFNVPDLRFVAQTGTTGAVAQQVDSRYRSHSLLGGITFNFGPPVEPRCTPLPGEHYDEATNTCVRDPVPLCSDGVTPTVPGPCPVVCPEGQKLNARGVCVTPCPDGTVPEEEGKCPLPPCPDGSPRPCKIPIYTVYFGWDKDRVGEYGPNDKPHELGRIQEAPQVLRDALAAYRASGVVHIKMVGHADRSGPPSHNDPLSCRRVNYVRDYFVQEGVPADVIRIAARGENDNAVETADGVKEVQNRRVVISEADPMDSGETCTP